MRISRLSEEDLLFCARIEDAVVSARERSQLKFLGFMDERQQELALQTFSRCQYNHYVLYGGYAGACRKALGVFPEFICLEQDLDDLFENIGTITVSYRAADVLSHRDFLGALMALNITRDSIGDILVGDGVGVLFATRPVCPVIREELTTVGRVGVQCRAGKPSVLPQSQNFAEFHDTVSSMRLDCIIAAITKCSREKAALLIRQGMVTQNYENVEQVSRAVEENDQITVRGYGKFIVAQVDGRTRKGRISLLFKKYV